MKKVGRPLGTNNKVPISIRLDRDIVEYYKSQGPGYLSKINEDLKKYIQQQGT